MLELRKDLRAYFPESDPAAFDAIMALEGEEFRNLAGRKTLRFALGENSFFAKLHFGVGWREIFKNLLSLRKPVLGAGVERHAIDCLEKLGVATMTVAGFGERGGSPARRQSFLITEELVGTVSLEDFCRPWPLQPPPVRLKWALIDKVAMIAKTLHENGLNHRDCYICHFLLDRRTLKQPPRPENLVLYLIDLHRMQFRSKTPQRWIVKDLAALHFSSMDIGLTRRDRLRFMRAYRNRSLRQLLAQEKLFWTAVENKANWLYHNPC